MKILILEDYRGAALALQHLLEKQGHTVVAMYMGVTGFQPFTALNYDKSEVVVDFKQFDVALVDGQMYYKLPSNKVKCIDFGSVAVAHLVDAGVPCIGISSAAYMNGSMTAAGAVCGANKMAVISALFLGRATIEEMLASKKGEMPAALKALDRPWHDTTVKQDPEVMEALKPFVDEWFAKS